MQGWEGKWETARAEWHADSRKQKKELLPVLSDMSYLENVKS